MTDYKFTKQSWKWSFRLILLNIEKYITVSTKAQFIYNIKVIILVHPNESNLIIVIIFGLFWSF